MNDPSHQRIVLIDDSPNDRAMIRSALMEGAPRRRYHFREASNGVEGLRVCEADDGWPIDCVIVDVHMPLMDGMQLLRKICGENQLPRLPVVVLTGSSESDDAKMALRAGAQDYVTKNAIRPSILFRVIDNAIERHRLLLRLHESEREAAAANRAKSALIGNISHEIRTPMTAVVGLSEVLLDGDLTDEQRTMLRMIRDNGTYLVDIVNDLLDLSKMEADMLEIEPEPTELASFLTDIIYLMKVRAEENRSTLDLQLEEGLPVAIEADPIRLRQVLLNLLNNAIKFSPRGNVRLEVSQETQDGVRKLQFAVRDTGCGIAPEDQELIFRPFAQLKGSRREKNKGTGLGLSICRRLAEAMGGTIHVESSVGNGSCFSVRMELREVPHYQAAKQEELAPLSRSVDEILQGCQVLIAEDTPATQFLLSRVIEKAGGRVTLVDDGEKLVETVRRGEIKFDVVITDVQMPKLDGLDATRLLLEYDSDLPVIVLTADALLETREAALSAGASDVVTKPIDRRKFLHVLARCCEQRCR